MLNQKEKFERFAQVINKNADDMCDEINAQVNETLKSQLSEIEYQAAVELDRRLKNESQRTSIVINRKISEIRAQSRKAVAQHREEITQKVFDQVREKLKVFCESEEYSSYLKNSVEKISSGINGKMTLYVKQSDVDTVKKITSAMPFVKGVEADREIVLGGIVAVSEDESIRIDGTMETRLVELEEWFKANSFLTV